MVEPAPLLVLYASQTGNAQVWISVGIESRSRKAVPASSTRQAVLRRRAAAPPPPPALASAFPSQSGPLQHPLLTFLCPGRCGAHWPRGAEAPLCAARAARRRLPTQRGQPALCACARVCGQHHGPGRASRQHAQPVALPAAQEPAARLAGRRAGSRVWAGRLGVRVRVRVLGGGGGDGWHAEEHLRAADPCSLLLPSPLVCPLHPPEACPRLLPGSYPKYNVAAKKLFRRLEALGARALLPVGARAARGAAAEGGLQLCLPGTALAYRPSASLTLTSKIYPPAPPIPHASWAWETTSTAAGMRPHSTPGWPPCGPRCARTTRCLQAWRSRRRMTPTQTWPASIG